MTESPEKLNDYGSAISDEQFFVFQDLMYTMTGVKLMPNKKALIVARLRKRLRELGIETFEQYLKIIKKLESKELEVFINAITTNETYFYRHPEQFQYLYHTILPKIKEQKKGILNPEVKIWSAACSTGEEPYSVGITCREFFRNAPDWNVIIYATDINSAVLDFSRNGVYGERALSRMPRYLKKLYFHRVKKMEPYKEEKYKLSSEIIDSVKFLKYNLMEPFPQKSFDVILLRNVMIYFDVKSKQRVVDNIQRNLRPKGYVFISLTETLSDVNSNLTCVYSGIYQRND